MVVWWNNLYVVLLLYGVSEYLASGQQQQGTRNCERNGITYNPGTEIKDNCNKCTCTLVQGTVDSYYFKCTNNVCLIQERIIYIVNYGNYGWTAGNHTKFWGMSLDQGIQDRLGSFPPKMKVVSMTPIFSDLSETIPSQFDTRTKWPTFIHAVRDQGNCGASWAFSTTDVIADRVSISTKGVLTDYLSVQHLISCNIGRGQNGCNGGYVDRAWQYIRFKGLLSENCYQYSSGFTNTTGPCLPKDRIKTNRCPSDVYSTLRTTPPYRISTSEEDIMREIMKNGPVQATMMVKEDFFMYKSGIYKYSKISPDNIPHGSMKAFHSVRLLGWGEEFQPSGEKVKYWLCANSWGPEWGENGLFRIERGNKESKIEAFIVATHISKLEVAPSETTIDKLSEIKLSSPAEFSFRRHFYGIYRRHVARLQRKKRARLRIAVMKEKEI